MDRRMEAVQREGGRSDGQEGRARVGGRWLYCGSENRCSNAPPRDYVHQAGALSHRVIMRSAIICDDDDEERAVVGIAPLP